MRDSLTPQPKAFQSLNPIGGVRASAAAAELDAVATAVATAVVAVAVVAAFAGPAAPRVPAENSESVSVATASGAVRWGLCITRTSQQREPATAGVAGKWRGYPAVRVAENNALR